MIDVTARLRRLEELAHGLSKELAIWRDGQDALLYLERRAYLNAVQDMLTAVETARQALSKAVRRMGDAAPAEA